MEENSTTSQIDEEALAVSENYSDENLELNDNIDEEILCNLIESLTKFIIAYTDHVSNHRSRSF